MNWLPLAFAFGAFVGYVIGQQVSYRNMLKILEGMEVREP